jgi:hypothetical protein
LTFGALLEIVTASGFGNTGIGFKTCAFWYEAFPLTVIPAGFFLQSPPFIAVAF